MEEEEEDGGGEVEDDEVVDSSSGSGPSHLTPALPTPALHGPSHQVQRTSAGRSMLSGANAV
eukprot:3141394-Rhodomonas_salina.4